MSALPRPRGETPAPGWDEAADLDKDPAEVAHMAEGAYIADMIATLAMLDPILGGIDR